jgi:hypothetical protein
MVSYFINGPLDRSSEPPDSRHGIDLPESVYFITFHKCASSLFGRYVLLRIKGLRHINYQKMLYDGTGIDKLLFEKKGHLYGPIRLSARKCKVVTHISMKDFLNDKIAIFLIRDPRDILVSAYYSQGYTHSFSKVASLRQKQKEKRRLVQSMTVDEYAIEFAPKVLGDFGLLQRLERTCSRKALLRYEDMVDNWDRFVEGFGSYLDVGPDLFGEMYKRTRPKAREDVSSHRRSGKPGGFRAKLDPYTISSLNATFEKVLERFEYSP